MTRSQLEHAIRAACIIADDTELIIFGSQSILGQYPNPPADLTTSIEVDVQPVNNPDAVIKIDGALGEMSPFHSAHGFYVHGVGIEAATLAAGWKERTIQVSDPVGTHGKIGYCLEAHDLAASKLVAYREKDRNFVRVLLNEKMVSPRTLNERLRQLPIENDVKERLVNWVTITAEDFELL